MPVLNDVAQELDIDRIYYFDTDTNNSSDYLSKFNIEYVPFLTKIGDQKMIESADDDKYQKYMNRELEDADDFQEMYEEIFTEYLKNNK